MNDKIKRVYVPMTESGFYILFCLQSPQHGYGISQQVKKLTGGAVTIGAGPCTERFQRWNRTD